MSASLKMSPPICPCLNENLLMEKSIVKIPGASCRRLPYFALIFHIERFELTKLMRGDQNLNPDGRLDSWKEISEYLHRSIRTCNLWAAKYGLPVHKIGSETKKSSVFAFKDELDLWFRNRARTQGERR